MAGALAARQQSESTPGANASPWLPRAAPRCPVLPRPARLCRVHSCTPGAAESLSRSDSRVCRIRQVSRPGQALPEKAPATNKPGSRKGYLAGCVLVPDPVERSENEHVKYPMPGAPGFVHNTADRTSLVSQCTQEGVEHVLEAMQHGAAGPPTCVVWISLRNELVTYIAGKPYALRDAQVSPF